MIIYLIKSRSDFSHDSSEGGRGQPLDRLEQGGVVERRQDDHHGDVVADVRKLDDVSPELFRRVVVELALLLHELGHADLEMIMSKFFCRKRRNIKRLKNAVDVSNIENVNKVKNVNNVENIKKTAGNNKNRKNVKNVDKFVNFL